MAIFKKQRENDKIRESKYDGLCNYIQNIRMSRHIKEEGRGQSVITRGIWKRRRCEQVLEIGTGKNM